MKKRSLWFSVLSALVINTVAPAVEAQTTSRPIPSAYKVTVLPADASGFGRALSMKSNVAIVGAPFSNVGSQSHAGAAYVLVQQNLIWRIQQQLVAPDAFDNSFFGYAVGISQNTAAVSGGGAVYVFERSGANFIARYKLRPSDLPSDNIFGNSIAVLDDVIVVGALGPGVAPGLAYVFERKNGIWKQSARLQAPDGAAGDYFGWAVAISKGTIVVGAPQMGVDAQTRARGAAYLFVRQGNQWKLQQKLLAPANTNELWFGIAASISGDSVLIGENNNAHVFRRAGNTWRLQQTLLPVGGNIGEHFGWSVSLDSGLAVVGSDNALIDGNEAQGAAYVYADRKGTWQQQLKIVSPFGIAGDALGYAVAASNNQIMLSGPGSSP